MKIGVIVAMGKELDLLLPLMENASQLQVNGFTFYCGNIGHAEIVAMKCGIGKVNAALGTFVMIENFAPKLIINTVWPEALAETPHT